MSEFLEDPSVLTKEKLKSELVANNVTLPSGEHRKDVYVQLYLQKLTSQNQGKPTVPDTFSSDEELPPPLVTQRSRSGRKATRKTDKPRPDDVDVTELTAEALKEQLLKYGVNPGPIMASTRKLYEKKLQKLLDQGPPEALPPANPPGGDGNQNGNTDSDQYSDKEEEPVVPEPEPVPVVEKPVSNRGKTPVTLRPRRVESNRCEPADKEEFPEGMELNVKRRQRRPLHLRDQAVPASDDTDFSESSTSDTIVPPHKRTAPAPQKRHSLGTLPACQSLSMDSPKPTREVPCKPSSASFCAPPKQLQSVRPSPMKPHNASHSFMAPPLQEVRKARVDNREDPALERRIPSQQPENLLDVALLEVEEKLVETTEDHSSKADGRDILKEMFPNEPSTPTGIIATCRRPIRGAAGRPLKPSDFWLEESRVRRTEHTQSSYTESWAPSHMATPVPAPARPVTTPPAAKRSRRFLPVWLQLLLLSAVVGFVFFIYQAMETTHINPFGSSATPNAGGTGK